MCPSDEDSCSGFPCLEGKSICRAGPQGWCVGLLCFLLQTLLSQIGTKQQQGRLEKFLRNRKVKKYATQKTASQGWWRTSRWWIIDLNSGREKKPQQNYLLFCLGGSSALGNGSADGSADSFGKQFSKHDSFTWIYTAPFPGNDSLPAPISKGRVGNLPSSCCTALAWLPAWVSWHRYPPPPPPPRPQCVPHKLPSLWHGWSQASISSTLLRATSWQQWNQEETGELPVAAAGWQLGWKGEHWQLFLAWSVAAQAGSWTSVLSVSECAKHFIPSLLPRKSIVLPPFAAHAVSAGKQGAEKQRGPGHLFHRRLGQTCKAGTGSSAFLADDSWQLWKTGLMWKERELGLQKHTDDGFASRIPIPNLHVMN